MESIKERYKLYNPSQYCAVETFRLVNLMSRRFFHDVKALGVIVDCATLPQFPHFNVVDGWVDLEQQIETAALANDAVETLRLCKEYHDRAEKYFAGWKQVIERRLIQQEALWPGAGVGRARVESETEAG